MNIRLPLTKEDIKTLKAGDIVSLSGIVYTARDAAHKRLAAMLEAGEPLPFDLRGACIYYAGAVFCGGAPTSAGPTTSARMDSFTPALLERGLSAVIGKGERSAETVAAIKRHGAVYFAAVGGAGAFYARRIVSSAPVAFAELGSEAVYRFEVRDFSVVVAVDSGGNTVYNK